MIEFFNLDRNDVEQRRTFNLISYGWRTQYDAFGGPARPSNEEIMQVESDETLYLRGSIRYTYNNRAWVDESNTDKAGKIKRYMTTGLEGRIYRDEFENALDLDKETVLDKYFSPEEATINILSDNLYWSIYAPGRTSAVESDTVRVYYNNLGEIFASKQLEAGDSYRIRYYRCDLSDEELAEAVRKAKGGTDRAYQAVRLLNRDVPEGIDSRLFDLVRQLISGKEEEYSIACTIRDYLKTNGTYTLNADYVPAERDFVSYFVLGDLHGYCMHFASAMTLMARIAGLPARYVEGYLYEARGNSSGIVTGQNAHAWSEVYFEGFGWVTFEATPSFGNRSNHSNNEDQTDPEERFADDHEDRNSNEEQLPTQTASPTPTPTPQPTPSPTPNNWEEDSEDDSSENTQDTEDPANQTDAEEDGEDEGEEESQKNNEDTSDGQEDFPRNDEPPSSADIADKHQDDQTAVHILLLLSFAALLAVLMIWTSLRLRKSDPYVLEKEQSSKEDVLFVWYKACLNALEIQGLSLKNGYTAGDLAEKAISMELADEVFNDFSRAVASWRYSGERGSIHALGKGKESYQSIVRRMKLFRRLKWYASRIKNKFGSIEQVP